MTNGFFYFLILIFYIIVPFSQKTFAACALMDSSGQTVERPHDALGLLLLSENTCPNNVFELRQLCKNSGLQLETTWVANRGFHNPGEGSFSLFEMVFGALKTPDNHLLINAGDFFFGHFTAINSEGELIADQNPEKNSLMIEAFAWDPKKEAFNFYELRGNGTQGQWIYRGDSLDIFADNELLHRQPDPQHPQFGKRLRCSGCHSAGGPIMKELDQPHNDWWDPIRGLDFGGRRPDASLHDILETLVSSEELAKNVIIGLKKLNQSKTLYRKQSGSLQEQLRPLFCPVELNLMSDVFPNDALRSEISIPAEFFLDPRFLQAEENQAIRISRTFYTIALNAVGSYFPETDLNDADHAWLTPVKAKSDQLAVDNLIQHGIIDQKFVLDVLDVDRTNPVFSSARCGLLRLLPNTTTPKWRETFMKKLEQSQDWAAKKLLKNLSSPQQNVEFYMRKAKRFLLQCQSKLQDSEHVVRMYHLLMQRRAEVRASEISLNPLGQILEPGFRVIFPENKIIPRPGALKLTSMCEVVEEAQHPFSPDLLLF
ncbi:hypothetical protein LEAN103870_12100 [Legionella anisa]|uniref:Rod shape-determining protein MreB n=1 Tax=Legionella anisa TaxID=28082 RepID=A0AAX0WQ54_9GAMM|nr:hypothetical protein [Legionella anisa]AWN75284.1 hypothetical protein DLD14_16400 [Legionella anisa]KTC72647.1 rod shape-determining protein MreB [Legionella anisa]MBN5935464.1 hypothetical protein [Legionella anisa]MCW8424544.1 hypothetical protein [Legionella anisa]MCW8446338.1 hypothetical protein [Legionella anisa]